MSTAFFVLMAAIGADPAVPVKAEEIPKGVREYFKRADELLAEKDKEYADKINRLEILLRGEANPRAKAIRKAELRQLEDLRDELKKKPPRQYLQPDPSIGKVGALNNCTVSAVIDGKTSVLTMVSIVDGKFQKDSFLVLFDYSTKGFKTGRAIDSADFFIVVGTKTENDDAITVMQQSPYRVIQPIKKADMLKYRALYDAEIAAKKVEAAKTE